MNAFDRMSAERATAVARATFGSNFHATRRKCGAVRVFEVRYDVPGHSLAVGTAGRGSTWSEAFRAAYAALGLVLGGVK